MAEKEKTAAVVGETKINRGDVKKGTTIAIAEQTETGETVIANHCRAGTRMKVTSTTDAAGIEIGIVAIAKRNEGETPRVTA